ncbi:MAG: TIGR04255 family protein [Phycisphaeraceae bacterium]|nr:TIGR04255 family protein [Phycisphaeraceae bacterium]
MPRDLPDYNHPPLVEVVLSVQFDELIEFSLPHFGLLWQKKYRSQFPRTEIHPPLNISTERFGVRSSSRPVVKLEMLEPPPLPRLWMLNDESGGLIQIQTNRIAYNWRKTRGEYPHYETIRPKFELALREFCSFVEEENLGNVTPNQCEITYVNHIERHGVWEHHGQVEKVFNFWSHSQHATGLPNTPENVTFSINYILPSPTGIPRGRLHVSMKPVFTRDNAEPLFELKLTVRGYPGDQSPRDCLDFMDQGHNSIVRGFTAITTPAMHDAWGRKQ